MKSPDLELRPSSTSSSARKLDLGKYPYLQRVERLQHAYPALQHLVDKLRNNDEGRRLVTKWHMDLSRSTPGRCAVLIFRDNHVEHRETFYNAEDLSTYLEEHPPARDSNLKQRRLFILEDMEPGFVDVLGHELGVNPLIFSEQMNTWNFTDSKSVSYRSLPSVATPEDLFTIRYYELRTLDHHEDPTEFRSRMTFALNRRKCERWRDLDLPSINADKTHGFIRRCASFWTSHDSNADFWDALMLVDPPMDSCKTCQRRQVDRKPDPEPSHKCKPTCLMLQDPYTYRSRKALWKSRDWKHRGSVVPVRHQSRPYHGGCTTLTRPYLCYAGGERRTSTIEDTPRNQASLFDETIFYWTKLADRRALEAARECAANSAYYLLKFVALSWDNHLEFIAYSVAQSEWFKDDHEASMDLESTMHDWKNELTVISAASKDINTQRRKMAQFEQSITLNLERMGMHLGDPTVNKHLPLALKDAQNDFLAIHSRLKSLRARVDDLSTIVNEVSALRAAFKSIEDGANAFKLNLFLAIFFPLTLVATMLSMGGDYLPGEKNFWVFWASSVPLATIIGAVLMIDRFRSSWNVRVETQRREVRRPLVSTFEDV